MRITDNQYLYCMCSHVKGNIVIIAYFRLMFISLLVCHSSASKAENMDIFFMNGTCAKLSIGKHDFSKECISKMASFTTQNGRVGFIFTVGDLATYSFSGRGQKQIRIHNGVVMQKLDRASFTLLGMGSSTKPNIYKADDGCYYTNPFAGQAKIVCEAKTKDGLLQAWFLTDGNKPSQSSF